MKIAILVPDDIFRDAEKLARRLKKSRSRLYTEAVAEYVARRAPAEVTRAYDRVAHAINTRVADPIAVQTRRRLLETEW